MRAYVNVYDTYLNKPRFTFSLECILITFSFSPACLHMHVRVHFQSSPEGLGGFIYGGNKFQLYRDCLWVTQSLHIWMAASEVSALIWCIFLLQVDGTRLNSFLGSQVFIWSGSLFFSNVSPFPSSSLRKIKGTAFQFPVLLSCKFPI